MRADSRRTRHPTAGGRAGRQDHPRLWGRPVDRGHVAAGLHEVPAVILDKSMAEWQYHNLQLVENVVRSDLSPFDLWQGCVSASWRRTLAGA